MKRIAAAALALAGLCGCASYSWKPGVPEEMRSVCVPVFRNESDVTELGNLAARQLLREFQREGTFKIASRDAAALEIQGVVKSVHSKSIAYERHTGARNREFSYDAKAEISVIDRRAGKVLVDSREYVASTTFLASDDLLTARRDASGRIAEDLARQIADDVLGLDFDYTEGAENEQ